MSEADFTALTSSLSTASLDRSSTAGTVRPNGGGSFTYGFNSLDASEGATGLFVNSANFIPTAKGGSISGAMKRGAGAATGFAPFLFIGAQSALVSAPAYMIGLSDSDGSRIMLRKAAIVSGLPDGPVTVPPTNGVLALSDDTVAQDTWVHLRLDQIVNTHGDVVLNVYQSDLTVNLVTAPQWVPIPGMTQIVDDRLMVNTASAPLLGGRMGFGFYKNAINRRGFFDYIAPLRQS